MMLRLIISKVIVKMFLDGSCLLCPVFGSAMSFCKPDLSLEKTL